MVGKRFSTLSLMLLLLQSLALAQGSVRDYRRAHEHEILSEFMELLAIPNVASDRENIRRNAAAIIFPTHVGMNRKVFDVGDAWTSYSPRMWG